MELNKVAEEFKGIFLDALNKISSVEARLALREKEFITKTEELSQQAEHNKKESLRLQKKAQDLIEKEVQVRSVESFNAEKLEKIEAEKKKTLDGFEKLKSAQASVETERQAIMLREQEVSRKEAYLDMEERRVKLFEHKLNLVVNDKKVQKELDTL